MTLRMSWPDGTSVNYDELDAEYEKQVDEEMQRIQEQTRAWDDRRLDKEQKAPKSVADRYFDLYQENKVNALHLVAFWYGDQPDDIGTNIFMRSTTNNEHLELNGLEMADSEELLQERIDACTLDKQYPEGFFAHLHSQLPYEREETVDKGKKRLQTWEEWGWDIIYYDDESDKSDGGGLLTEEQRTELDKRLKIFHGERQYVAHDWYCGDSIKRTFYVVR